MGEIEFLDPRPYVRIADKLRQQILDGELAPGDAVPSISDIRRGSGHSRQTVSKAMRLLAGEGLIFQTPGHPYCVTGQRPIRSASGSNAPGNGGAPVRRSPPGLGARAS